VLPRIQATDVGYYGRGEADLSVASLRDRRSGGNCVRHFLNDSLHEAT
jgi:hypothetical protein